MHVLQKWTTNSIKTNFFKKASFSPNVWRFQHFWRFWAILKICFTISYESPPKVAFLLQNKRWPQTFSISAPISFACVWGHAAAFAVNAALVASQWHRTWTSSLHSPISANHEAGQAASPAFPSLRYDPTGDRPSLLYKLYWRVLNQLYHLAGEHNIPIVLNHTA